MEIEKIELNKLYLYTQSNGISKKVRVINLNPNNNEIELIVEDEIHSDNNMKRRFNRIECERYLSELTNQ